MARSKIRLAVMFGGMSAEHEISLISAKNIIAALDKKYEPVLIGIGKDGKWYLQDEQAFMEISDDPKKVFLPSFEHQLAAIPGGKEGQFLNLNSGELLEPVDVLFPIVHGPMGEDGSLQGILEHLRIAYVGPGVLASSSGMDKIIFKQLMTQAGIPNSRFVSFSRSDQGLIDYKKIEADLGSPLFIKPANMGSSVGISKASNAAEFKAAINLAFQFDDKVLVEECIIGREIECAVLGNEEPKASIPGEIIPMDGFYSYEAKYIDEKGAALEAPAPGLDEMMIARIQELAIKAYRFIGCEGLSRVDFFLKENGEIIINEINTLPGFTRISMYPRLWRLSGIPYSELIDELVDHALERHKRRESILTAKV